MRPATKVRAIHWPGENVVDRREVGPTATALGLTAAEIAQLPHLGSHNDSGRPPNDAAIGQHQFHDIEADLVENGRMG